MVNNLSQVIDLLTRILGRTGDRAHTLYLTFISVHYHYSNIPIPPLLAHTTTVSIHHPPETFHRSQETRFGIKIQPTGAVSWLSTLGVTTVLLRTLPTDIVL